MKEMYIHNGEPQTGFDIVDENKTVVPKYSLTLCNPSHELISVDHFYTKSYEEWVEKMNRGSAHSNFSRRCTWTSWGSIFWSDARSVRLLRAAVS